MRTAIAFTLSALAVNEADDAIGPCGGASYRQLDFWIRRCSCIRHSHPARTAPFANIRTIPSTAARARVRSGKTCAASPNPPRRCGNSRALSTRLRGVVVVSRSACGAIFCCVYHDARLEAEIVLGAT
jgi:hypothetical protein